jgi:dipeptidyl aminopeptidase/acylaminoacyl peptidase
LAGLAVAAAGVVAFDRPTAAQTPPAAKKRPLTHKDYEIWNQLQPPTLSPDGKVVAYSILPPEGDGTLYVKNLGSGAEFTIARAGRPAGPAEGATPGEPGGEPGVQPTPPTTPTAPTGLGGRGGALGAFGAGGSGGAVFSPDSKKLFINLSPAKADLDKAKAEKKDPPKAGLCMIDATTGKIVERFEKARRFEVFGTGAGFLVMSKEPEGGAAPATTDDPTAQPGAGGRGQGGGRGGRGGFGQGRGGAMPGGGQTPTGTPFTRRTFGTDLVVRNLKDNSERIFPEVSEYSVTRDHKELVFVVASKKEENNGVYVVDLDSQAGPAAIRTGKGRYSRLTWDRKQTKLAFVYDDTQPADKQAEKKADEKKVEEKKPMEKKVEEKKPEEKKSELPKPTEKKPEEKKSELPKPSEKKTEPKPNEKAPDPKKPEKKGSEDEDEDQPPTGQSAQPVTPPAPVMYRVFLWDRYANPRISMAPAGGGLFYASAFIAGPVVVSASEVVGPDTVGMPKGYAVAGTGGLSFAADGTKLAVALNKLPDPAKPAMTLTLPAADRVDLDLWHWKDEQIQPMQKVARGGAGRGGAGGTTATAIYFLDTKKFCRVGDDDATVSLPAAGDWGVSVNSKPYAYLTGYGPSLNDTSLVNVRTGEKKPLLKGVEGIPAPSPSGKYLTRFDGKNWTVIAVADGKTTNLTEKLPVKFFNEDFDAPSTPPPYRPVQWTSDEKFLLLSDKYDVWKIAPDGSAAENLTRIGRDLKIQFRILGPAETDPTDDETPRGTDISKPLLLHAEDLFSRDTGFYRLDPGQKPKLLVMGARKYGIPQKAKNADTYLLTISTFSDPADYYVADRDFKEIRRVTDAQPRKQEFNWGKAELIHYQSADGVPLSGILIKPEDFDPAKKYPMIVYIYERLSQNLHNYVQPNAGTSINATYYASNGYLVLMPDIAYTIGSPGQSALKCVLPAIQTVANMGFLNENAIGIQGHSWGGYQIAYMITQTNRFKAAEAGAPVSNMVSAYGGIRWGTGLPREFQYERTQSRIGKTLWEAPMKYLENSPVLMADRVQTPLMILHNDNDDAVPWYQGIEYYLALRRLGKECYLFNYNGEPHGLRKRASQKDYTMRMQQFFDHHLKGAPAPEWMVKGIPYTEREKEKEQWKSVLSPEKKQ